MSDGHTTFLRKELEGLKIFMVAYMICDYFKEIERKKKLMINEIDKMRELVCL